MTVSYSADVATESFSVFWKVLVRWKGTVYKILWKEFLIFIAAYLTINFSYRFGLKQDPEKRRMFQSAVLTCQKIAEGIPLAFILGFYISIVIKRFWERYDTLPFPDALGFWVTTQIFGEDEKGRLIRRTIIRYVNIAFILVMRQISTAAKKRFPTLQHLVDSGVMTDLELEAFEKIQCKYARWWVPLGWCNSIISQCKKEGRIKDEYALATLVQEISNFNDTCRRTFDYDWVCIPLVYTQVVIIAVYSYFLTNLMGKQLVDLDEAKLAFGSGASKAGGPQDTWSAADSEFSWLSTIFFLFQFLFYMGWLKIAATIFNPFGEDDDDFEINYLIDRNMRVGFVFVDDMHNEHPDLIKDSFWDTKEVKLPYTSAAAHSEKEEPKGSAADVQILPEESHFLPLNPIPEENVDLEKLIMGSNINLTATEANGTGAATIGTKARPIGIGKRYGASRASSITGSIAGGISIGSISKSVMTGPGDMPSGTLTRRSSFLKRIGSNLVKGKKKAGTGALSKNASDEVVALMSKKLEELETPIGTVSSTEFITDMVINNKKKNERLPVKKKDSQAQSASHLGAMDLGATQEDSLDLTPTKQASPMDVRPTSPILNVGTYSDDIFRFSLHDIHTPIQESDYGRATTVVPFTIPPLQSQSKGIRKPSDSSQGSV